MKNLKIAIIAVLIITIIIILILTFLFTNKENKENKELIGIEEYEEEEEFEYEAANKLEQVKDKNTYYAVKKIVEKYITYCSYIHNTEMKQEQEKNIEAIYEMLDKDYREKYKITTENIKEYHISYDSSKQLNIPKIDKIEKNSRINLYWIEANIDYSVDLKLIVKTDSYHNTFSIFPEEYIKINQYNKQNIENKLDIDSNDISPNSYNTFQYINITNEQHAKEYVKDYINKATYQLELAYECLENSYKEKRFATIQEYRKYIDSMHIKDVEIEKCYIEKQDNITQYTCKTQYGMVFILKETGLMEYTVQLDDYTLENKEFQEKYKEVSNRDKGLLNIDKFFKMINMQDYTSAYQVLDQNFKQNYFKTQIDFENYMKTKTFRYNKVTYKEYNNQITGIHNYKIELLDATGENQNQVEFNIVMKLLEETDFVMSFSVS